MGYSGPVCQVTNSALLYLDMERSLCCKRDVFLKLQVLDTTHSGRSVTIQLQDNNMQGKGEKVLEQIGQGNLGV